MGRIEERRPQGHRRAAVLRRFAQPQGVVLIGVAQERASAWSATKQGRGRWVDFVYFRKSACVNHYHIYVTDRECGPAFIKVCGYAPNAIKMCLNGHERAKRQLQRRRIRTADGLTNARLRPLVASLLGSSYTTRQMGYDLRRLIRKGLIRGLDAQKRYVLTPYGRRVAPFLTKVHARILRPGLQALDLNFAAHVPPPLRTALATLDRAIHAHIAEAQPAA